jgi:hypothetical protein
MNITKSPAIAGRIHCALTTDAQALAAGEVA